MRVVRRFARAVAQKFHPAKIILFGSHAYGRPHDDSDVDILVVMAARNEIDQAVKIRLVLAAPFPMDLIVRTPEDPSWRLEAGDSLPEEPEVSLQEEEILDQNIRKRIEAKKQLRGRLAGQDNAIANRILEALQQASEIPMEETHHVPSLSSHRRTHRQPACYFG